jgi:hypothetical protein
MGADQGASNRLDNMNTGNFIMHRPALTALMISGVGTVMHDEIPRGHIGHRGGHRGGLDG